MGGGYVVIDLRDEVAIVTGASRGLGKEMALALSRAGAQVAVVSRNVDQLKECVREIERAGGRGLAVRCDVADAEQVARMVDEVRRAFGRIDILVNNAGIAVDKEVTDITVDEFSAMVATNVYGPFLCTRAVGPYMIERRKGKVINIASIAGIIGLRSLACYGATKGAVIQLTRGLAVEWARYGITVNAICPGYIETGINEVFLSNEQLRKKVVDRIPLRRIGLPEEIAGLVVFLASKAADYITGHVLVADGGQTVS